LINNEKTLLIAGNQWCFLFWEVGMLGVNWEII